MLTLQRKDDSNLSNPIWVAAEASSLCILIVEDDLFYRQWIARIVEKCGHLALVANDGKEAIAILKRKRVEIVISDLNMPHTNGIELAQHIRGLNLDRYIHIIMVTGHDDEDGRRDALDNGVDDFINKGTNPSLLLARLRTATRMVRHEKELATRHRELRIAIDRIKRDLSAANEAQQSLLPQLHNRFADVAVRSKFLPSSYVSGDMFGCFDLGKGLVGFYLVDVAGHGVRSSLLSVAIGHLVSQEFFAATVFDTDGALDPARLVTDLNGRFHQRSGDDYFTMFCGIIDTAKDTLHFCQAGHPSPLIAVGEDLPFALGDGGMPAGMFPFADFSNDSVALPKDAVLLLCSDAATEAENPDGQLFGEKRLSVLMQDRLAAGTETLIDDVVAGLDTWCQGAPLRDDLTLIEFNRRP